MNVCVGMQSSNPHSLIGACVFKWSVVFVPNPPAVARVAHWSLMLRWHQAPVLAGEEEGESGDYLMPSHSHLKSFAEPLLIFKKTDLSCCEEVEPRRVADRAKGGVAAVSVLLNLILSAGHRAGEVIKIVQLGMTLETQPG